MEKIAKTPCRLAYEFLIWGVNGNMWLHAIFSRLCKKTDFIANFLFIHYTGLTRYQYYYVFRFFLNKLFIGLRKKLCLDVCSMEKSLYIAMALPAVFGCGKHPHCVSIYIELRSHLKLPNFTQPRRLKQNIFLQTRNVNFSIFYALPGENGFLN